MKTVSDINAMRSSLLDWYDRSGRTLPWRVRPEDRARGIRPDPYAIWLSEIMLQQTTIPHGTPYWYKFLEFYPTVSDLAAAPLDEVLAMWAGLGYYARARNLHKCARIVAGEKGGQFPDTRKALMKLPGIGDYTASTIAAICFDEPTTIVDGNVERVIARVARIGTPLPKGKKDVKVVAQSLSDPDRPGDYGQALMDLGATVCTPKTPRCSECVWNPFCESWARGDMHRFPVKLAKKAQPVRYGRAYVMIRRNCVFLRRRLETGLLGGMMEVPTSDWTSALPDFDPPMVGDWQRVTTPVRHVFTHFDLRLDVHWSEITGTPDGEGAWYNKAELGSLALPSLMQKVLESVKTLSS